MLWGMLMSSAFCTLVIPKKSAPKKALAFYLITFSSMYLSKVAFSERIIDAFYPIFRQDVDRIYGDIEGQVSADKVITLGKSRPVNAKMTDSEKKLHLQRLEELRENKSLLAKRFDQDAQNTGEATPDLITPHAPPQK